MEFKFTLKRGEDNLTGIAFICGPDAAVGMNYHWIDEYTFDYPWSNDDNILTEAEEDMILADFEKDLYSYEPEL